MVLNAVDEIAEIASSVKNFRGNFLNSRVNYESQGSTKFACLLHSAFSKFGMLHRGRAKYGHASQGSPKIQYESQEHTFSVRREIAF